MPVLQRKQLRRDLGQRRLRTTTIGTTSLSLGANASLAVMDRTYAIPDFSGQELYERAYLRVASTDYRIGSYNAPSGAFVGLTPLVVAIANNADFEINERISPGEMDRAIDETIMSLPVRREIGIPTVAGVTFYTLDGAASPNAIRAIMNVYYHSSPASSLNRTRQDFQQQEIVTTMSGVEVRIHGGLAASMQLMLDVLLQMSLGAGDAATINLPDEEVILWGAAARCYDLLLADAPATGQTAAEYRTRRAEAARTFSLKSRRFLPEIIRKLTFETAFETEGG